ncbi:MAG: tripartite tricarboxylate transporter TctB family protein [Alkalilacustris sp.]
MTMQSETTTTAGTVRAQARRRQQRQDAIFAVVMMAFAVGMVLVVIPAGVRVPASVAHLPLSPRFFPYVLNGMVFAFALALLVMTYLGPPPLPEDAQPVETRRDGLLRLAVLAAALAGYVQLPEVAGMLPVAVLGTLALLVVGGERRFAVLIGVGVVVPVLVYLLFTEVFHVPMPSGPLLERS